MVWQLMKHPDLNSIYTLMKLLISNVFHILSMAKNTLRFGADGCILEHYTPSAREGRVNWPSPLPQSTWLKIGTVFSEKPTEMRVKMYIKRQKRYAFHPDLAVEVPILDPEDEDLSNVSPSELRTCTIDIRRDRLRGLFRYYVTKVE